MIDLRGKRSALKISPTVWTMTLELGRLCGWQPAGTVRINGHDGGFTDHDGHEEHGAAVATMNWRREYLTSDGQTFASDDARNLADALERAAAGQCPPTGDLSTHTPASAFGWFNTPAGQNHLKSLTSFLRQGQFQIL